MNCLESVIAWYNKYGNKLDVGRTSSEDLTDAYLKQTGNSDYARESIKKYVLRARKHRLGENDVKDSIKRNLNEAKVFVRNRAESFIPTGIIPEGENDPESDTPDFDDPISAMIEIPDSWSEINNPYSIQGVTNIGICSDLHLPYHDKFAIQACLSEFKKRGVDGIYLNGDIMDYEKVSHYAQMPDGRYLKDEIEVGRKFLQSLRKMFPNIPIYFKAGNHERRLEMYIADKCPELYNFFGADTQTQLGLADLGITYIPEQTVANFGKLFIAHGHELGLKSGTVNIARQVRMRVGVNIIFGHWHKNQNDSSRNLADETHAAWSLGCLCYLKPRYTGVLNQWTQGAATVQMHEGGKFTVSPFQIQDGEVI